MEAPDRKRLKSTFRPPPALPPLAPGWTEHAAPTGHKYYYNAQTKSSTYTRPVAPVAPVNAPPQPAYSPAPPAYPSAQHQHAQYQSASYPPAQYPPAQYNPYPQDRQSISFRAPSATTQDQPHHFHRRPQPQDRPKRKEVIPNCQPWVIVYTKLGRRFVHNPHTHESFWKFPQDVMKAVVHFDRLKLDEKLNKPAQGTGANNTPLAGHPSRTSSAKLPGGEMPHEDKTQQERTQQDKDQQERAQQDKDQQDKTEQDQPQDDHADSSSEYEEIEVTDDEDDQGRQPHQDSISADQQDQPVEFDEDDIAYQLAAMEQSYGLDPGEYGGEGDYEEGTEGLPLTDQDSAALFCDMLQDLHVSPYTPWETLIEDGRIIDDDRYTVLPTTKRRKEVWSEWSREKIVHLRAQKQNTEKQDPRIPYLALLSEKATPKLYWPEFRRKYKKEPEMRDAKLNDKDREKLYREHIARLKLSSSQLKSDLVTLLKSLPLKLLNRESSLDTLPKELLIDVRYISLPPKSRDALIEAHISTLGPPPDDAEAATAEQQAEKEKQAEERRRREAALREREEKVQEEKRRRDRELRIGMSKLKEGERELEQAMLVGRGGLRAQLDDE